MKLPVHLLPNPLFSAKSAPFFAVFLFVIILGTSHPGQGEEEPAISPRKNLPTTETEAAGRARWLHETIHGSLQVMHRDFFGDGDEDDSLSLPSQSLEDVFKEMARSWSVELRWLGGNATQDKEHEPQDDFEKEAVKALVAGKPEFSKMEGNTFRFVGAITLHNQCLKCHVPLRSSLENRVAGLSISIPLQTAVEDEAKEVEAKP